MNKWSEIFMGLVLLIGGVLLWYYTLGKGFWDFGRPAWDLFKGAFLWGIIVLGILFVALGISDLKN